jgi:transposase
MDTELKFEVQKLGPQVQEEVRKKIIREMQKHGNTKEVAALCECSLSHVQSTWKKYNEGGIEAIKAVKMGRPKGSGCKLTPEQESVIIKLIIEQTPEQTGLSGYLWERKSVSELVKQEFGVEMPLSTMGYYLSKWNFTYQRPKKTL